MTNNYLKVSPYLLGGGGGVEEKEGEQVSIPNRLTLGSGSF